MRGLQKKNKIGYVLMAFSVFTVFFWNVGCKKKNSVKHIVKDLKCEYLHNPVGIDIEKPRLSWVIESSKRGTVQSAYQVMVAKSLEDLESENNLLWDTEKVLSDQSIHVEYEGPRLISRQRYYWKVRIWDDEDSSSDWSETHFWEMGLLDEGDWKAEWIEVSWEESLKRRNPAQYFRTTFSVTEDVKKARAYATAHGVYYIEMNGKKVGNIELAPGFTSFHSHLLYQTYDIKDLIKKGENAIGAIIGDGRYRGSFGSHKHLYGTKLALLIQVEIEYENGKELLITSGEKWKCSTGPIQEVDFFLGETYDARLEMPGWSTAGFDDAKWHGVKVADPDKSILKASISPPIRVMEELPPRTIFNDKKGNTIIDFGQNIVGRIRINLRGTRGQKVTFKHGEWWLKEEEKLIDCTEGGESPAQNDTYIFKGEKQETMEPLFTFHGFRYVLVEGYKNEIAKGDVQGVVLYSDLEQSGIFECSHSLVNRLQNNIVWSQRGNFLDIPTDCPTREKLGWTGDIQIYAKTACFNMNSAGFLTKWLKDLRYDQDEDGNVPWIIPNPIKGRPSYSVKVKKRESSGWGDAATIIPWTLYLVYGDTRILEQQYESMKKWVHYTQEAAKKAPENYKWEVDPKNDAHEPYIWDVGYSWGDWFQVGLSIKDNYRLLQDSPEKSLYATAFNAYSARLLAKMAEVLGKGEDAKKYNLLHERIKEAFNYRFVSKDGSMKIKKQSPYIIALYFDLLPDKVKKKAAADLVELIKKNGYHIRTGFIATPYICHVLSDLGQLEAAYKLLFQDTIPSWLYEVKMGATTIWERWDTILEDGSIRDTGISHNHYAFGAIGDWIYQTVAGLRLDENQPGYKHIIIKPELGGGLDWAKATYQSMYGKIVSGWEVKGKKMTLQIVVPANTTASVYLKEVNIQNITERGKSLSKNKDIKGIQREGEYTVVKIGSGKYDFEYDIVQL